MNSLVLASLSLPNLVSRLPGGVAQGIIWGIMALGVYICLLYTSPSPRDA